MHTQPTCLDWEAFISRHTEAHLLQTTDWGKLKASFGWSVECVIAGDTGAQILLRRFIPGITFAYLAKGPVGAAWDVLWPEIDAACKRKGAAFLIVEPDVWLEAGKTVQPPPGFHRGKHSIQPASTLLVDISHDENSILGCMKQKTRYNIKLAQKKGVVVRPSTDLEGFHRLMQITGSRDQFGVHRLEYYRRAYELFHQRNACELLMAEYNQLPLAALMVFSQGIRAWYLYGASSNEHRDLMPTYLLQWEAMRWARARGCTQYDLWGVPDTDEESLEAGFMQRSDGLWGVYRNKRGFGGQLRRAAGPWERIYTPLVYNLYTWWVSRRGMVSG